MQFSYSPLLRTLLYKVATKTASGIEKHMFATLARSTDETAGSFKMIGAASSMFVSLRPLCFFDGSAVSYCCFVLFSCRPLRRALSCMAPNKQHPTYKKDMFATLARSTDESAGSLKTRSAAGCMFVTLRPLPSPFLQRKGTLYR